MEEVNPLPHPFVILLVLLFLLVVPAAKLLRRTGHHSAWSIFAVFPGLNLIAFWYFAFKRWPTDAKSLGTKN